MPYKIFLSHNSHDKPVVEPVAIRLAKIFGTDEVFYDAWSIRPGDSIIDQMNKGLAAPEFVFFFVSVNSLASGMVKLEWQNALYSATNGKVRIIPVRVDGAPMPAILTQTLYIDMHTIGLEAAIAQIVSVTQGNASFTPQHQGFSNLTYAATTDVAGVVDVTVRASHLMEPKPNFMMLVSNEEADLTWMSPGAAGYHSGFHPQVKLSNGLIFNGIVMQPMNAVLTPAYPVRFRLTPTGAAKIELKAVMHQASEDSWHSVPKSETRRGVSFLDFTKATPSLT